MLDLSAQDHSPRARRDLFQMIDRHGIIRGEVCTHFTGEESPDFPLTLKLGGECCSIDHFLGFCGIVGDRRYFHIVKDINTLKLRIIKTHRNID